MELVVDQEDVKAEVMEAMHELASNGANVRELVQCIRSGLGLRDNALLPILWYFMKAFHLPLIDVLPIREWLGTSSDQEIDALILPAIRRTQALWAADSSHNRQERGLS